MESNGPLISILVLCYNNQQYIYENLKSIFEQTYPNIEVLIGDDASQDFNAESLINWINKYRTPNVKQISIYESEENVGTVANLERLQEKSNGEYFFNIAADDVLFDENVIQSFYDRAVELGENAEFITAQTELWDQSLKNKIGDFLTEDIIGLLKNGYIRDVFAELSWHACLPACSFYRRSLLEKIGKLSDTYRLVEDWPWALRMTRMGIKPCYLDIRSSIKHRDGGISHGNSLHSQEVFLTYYRDILNIYVQEIEPYKDLLTEEEQTRAQTYYQDRIRAYYRIHLPQYLERCKSAEGRKMPEARAEKQVVTKTTEKIMQVKSESKQMQKKAVLRREFKKVIFQVSSDVTIFRTLVIGLLSIIASSAIVLIVDQTRSVLQETLLLFGIFLFIVAIIEIAINIWLQIRHFRQNMNDL